MAAKRPTQRAWSRFSESLRDELVGLAGEYAERRDPLRWYEAFHAAILEGHTQAAVMGRQRAGLLHERDASDVLLGRAAADAQGEFLQGFLDRLASGGYEDPETGELALAQVEWRSGLYAKATLGTANEAWLAAGDPDEEVWWVRQASESCPDCIEWADDSPYLRSTLAIVPGGGHTLCVMECHCLLKTASGTGFRKAL